MTYENTEHAGGAKKNRVLEKSVYFPAGSYLVFYQTDDSHAYKQWNANQPYKAEAWGIAVYPPAVKNPNEIVSPYSEDDDRKIIAQIIRVGNEENLNANFSINSNTEIRIYAIGEGDRHEMYDYCWIQDDNGNIVWEMEYRDTKWAGGAKKNRCCNEIIHLNKGKYIVHYTSDDSHSYRRWNTTPPRDQIHWGVTIIKNGVN
jgi:hypothetical protein